jgi:hypothetical protein
MRRLRSRLTYANVTVLLLVFISLGTVANAAPSTLVPSNGRVDGRTYGEWLAKSWQVRLAKPPSASLCQPVGNVGLILSAPPPFMRRATHRCSVPVGHMVYVSARGAECSTIEKPPYRGRTSAQLRACAREQTGHFSHFRMTIDGKAVRHTRSFVKASPVFRFHMPKHNILGLRKRAGRGAAYGAGFLLRGLAVGPHVVQRSDYFSGWRYETTYRIQVEG